MSVIDNITKYRYAYEISSLAKVLDKMILTGESRGVSKATMREWYNTFEDTLLLPMDVKNREVALLMRNSAQWPQTHIDKLKDLVTADPTLYLQEISDLMFLWDNSAGHHPISSISHTLQRLNLTRKVLNNRALQA